MKGKSVLFHPQTGLVRHSHFNDFDFLFHVFSAPTALVARRLLLMIPNLWLFRIEIFILSAVTPNDAKGISAAPHLDVSYGGDPNPQLHILAPLLTLNPKGSYGSE